MTALSLAWNWRVKALAQNCLPEVDYIRLEALETVKEQYKDFSAMLEVAKLVIQIEYAIHNKKEKNLLIPMKKLYNGLNAPDYLMNAFNSNSSDKEYKNLMAFKGGLEILINAIEEQGRLQ